MENDPDISGIRFSNDADLDARKVPSDLRDLVEFAKFWSIGDDCERSEVSKRTAFANKKAMVDAVLPRVDRINSWCLKAHAHQGAIPNEVCLFEMLLTAFHEEKFLVHPKLFSIPHRASRSQTQEDVTRANAALKAISDVFESPILRELDPGLQKKLKASVKQLKKD